MEYKILIADDETEIIELLQLYLEKNNYKVVGVNDGTKALEALKNHSFDLAIVDIMMPKMDGYQLLKKIREISNIPVMILSAQIEDNSKILGLDLGADDYITKPFNPLEVASRVAANLRRYYNLNQPTPEIKQIQAGGLVLDTEQCLLFKEEAPIQLTSTEYKIMKLFMENPGRVFTKQQLFEAGWGESHIVDDNTIMVCISKLRTKIEDDGVTYITTIRGLGYRLEKKI